MMMMVMMMMTIIVIARTLQITISITPSMNITHRSPALLIAKKKLKVCLSYERKNEQGISLMVILQTDKWARYKYPMAQIDK